MISLSIGRLAGILFVVSTLAACGGGGSSGESFGPVGPSPAYTSLQAAEAMSPYADVLADCAVVEFVSESCSLSILPLLGQETDSPSVADVLDRTVVSHPWMGPRFREVLERLPVEVLDLMKPVTAIVIAADIRPSFYSGATAAIYLDPAYLWLSNAERQTVSKRPDYRAEFGDELRFVSLARYVLGADYAWESFSLTGSESRTIDDIELPMAALLFHELAHANDFITPAALIFIDDTMSAYEAVASLSGAYVSDVLAAQQALNSQLWLDLGAVLYLGADPTASQLNLTPRQVGLEFAADGASDSYAYSTIREDVAMLFEEVMMNYHFGIDREIAYTNAPAGEDSRYCDSYVVSWGVRGRISDPLVKSRAEVALQLLLGEMDVSRYLARLPNLQRIAIGRDWCEVYTAAATSPQALKAQHASPAAVPELGRKPMVRDDLLRGYE